MARLTLQIPDSGSLKSKRQVLRRVTDRLRARFNVAVAEVADNDLWQKAVIAFTVIGNEQAHVQEQVDKVIHFVEEMYVAPLMHRETEILSFGDQLFAGHEDPLTHELSLELPFPKGDRSLAEAEGMGDFSGRHGSGPAPGHLDRPEHPERPGHLERSREGGGKRGLTLEERRHRALALRNPRDWEKK